MNEIAVQQLPRAVTAGPGRRLAAAREAQRLTVAEAAAALKLSPRQIEALEHDSYDQLPGAIFVRGFLRGYARWLKIDPAPILASAESLLGPSSPIVSETSRPREVTFPERRSGSWRAVALIVGALLLGAFAYEAFLNQPGRGTVPVATQGAAPPAPAAVRESPAPAAPEGQAASSVGNEPAAAKSEGAASKSEAAPAAQSNGAGSIDEPKSVQESVATRSAAPPPATATAAAPASAVQSPEPARANPAAVRMLRFVFDADSWVQIRDKQGAIIESRLNTADTVRSIAVQPPVALVIGNAAGVRMSVDGEPFDLKRHINVDVARFKLE